MRAVRPGRPTPEHSRSVNEQASGPPPAENRNVALRIHLVAAPPDILYIRGLARVQGSESGVAGSRAGGHQ
jgi:hypothetical protein